MTRYLMLALAALALLMLVTTACLVVEVEDYDMACRVVEIPHRYNYPVVEQHGPYVRLVRLRLPSGPVLLYRGPFDNAAEISGRTPACFFP